MNSSPDNLTHPRRGGRSAALAICGLLLATLVVYGQVADYEFVNYDDDVHVYQNRHVSSGLKAENVRWAFTIHGPSQWHPLAWLSHQWDCELFGLDPRGHHVTNVVLHSLGAIVLFLVLDAMTGYRRQSLFVALLYAVHPQNVESVAWVSERRNVLCGLFWMLTMAAYLWYARRPRMDRYLAVMAGMALGLMSKPLMVSLPCVLILLDFWPMGRVKLPGSRLSQDLPGVAPWIPRCPPCSVAWAVAEKLPLVFLCGIAAVLTIWCQQAAEVVVGLERLPLSLRLANAVFAAGTYLQRMFWPAALAVFYPHPALVEPDPYGALLAPSAAYATVMAAVCIWAVRSWRRSPYVAVGWCWFLVTLIPMIGIVQVGEQQMADRYTYVAQLGIFIAVVWLVASHVTTRARRRAALLLAGAILVGLMAACYVQAGCWQNSHTLFQRALAVTRKNHYAHNNLGLALLDEQRYDEARMQFEHAVAIDPRYALAHYNLGVVLEHLGRAEAAIQHLREALRIAPNYPAAHARLGAMLARRGEFTSAIEHFRQAVALEPDSTMAHFNLALTLSRMGNVGEANACFRRVLELDPGDFMAHYGLALGLRQSGDLVGAQKHLALATQFERARREVEDPGSGDAR